MHVLGDTVIFAALPHVAEEELDTPQQPAQEQELVNARHT